MRFQNCLTFINTIAGNGKARDAFASSLQSFMDDAGVTHSDVLIPLCKDIRPFTKSLNTKKQSRCEEVETKRPFDCVAVCGGDGTVSSVVHAILSTSGSEASHCSANVVPIVLVPPLGSSSSIATALGISTPWHSRRAFGEGIVRSVPIYRVRVNGVTERYMLSHLSVGLYTDIMSSIAVTKASIKDVVWRPVSMTGFIPNALKVVLLGKLGWKGRRGGSGDVDGVIRATRRPQLWCNRRKDWVPCKLVVASQVAWLQDRVCLTPEASLIGASECGKKGSLHVTFATEAATTARLVHLFCREAPCGALELEDGLEIFTTENGCADASEIQDDHHAQSDNVVVKLKVPIGHRLLIDGEFWTIPSGDASDATVTVENTSYSVDFLTFPNPTPPIPPVE